MRRTELRLALLCFALAVVMLLPNPSSAATVTTFENAQLTTGSLTGTKFVFSWAYDSSSVTGVGQEFIPLTAFDFTLGGATYNFADHTQGGQSIFPNRVLQNFTAFFPNKPQSPVFSIAFGFGGFGVIGYRDLNFDFGEGSFTQAVPEPSSIFSLGLCLAALIKMRGLSPHFFNSISS